MTDLDRLKAVLRDFEEAAAVLLSWYDGKRFIETPYGPSPTATAVQGMTMLRTATMNAQRLEDNLPPLQSRLPQPGSDLNNHSAISASSLRSLRP